MGTPCPQGRGRDDTRGQGGREAPGDHEGPFPGGHHLRLEEKVGELLRQKERTLALAESCTGGLIAKMLTDVPGSSVYFLASLVTYSNRSKVDLLGVDPSTLARCGAVSEEVAREMAAGARRVAGSDIGLAVTGIAGPGGGSPEKPVGLVYFALDDGRSCKTKRTIRPGDRAAVRNASAQQALLMLCEHLEGQ